MPAQEIVQHTTDFLDSGEIHVEAAGAGVARFGLSGFDPDELCCGLVPLAHPLVDPLVAGRGRSLRLTQFQYHRQVENSDSFAAPLATECTCWRANSVGVSQFSAEWGRVSL